MRPLERGRSATCVRLESKPASMRASTEGKAMKGYWLILGEDVRDQEAQKRYGELWTAIAAKYEAKVRALDTYAVVKEAQATTRVVVVDFPSYEQAKACYDDPAYQEAAKFAIQASKRELLILQGELI